MAITSVKLSNFRNLSTDELVLAHCNILYGDNGSGKTSFLEAIYYLSLGRSFRTSTAARLIQHETNHFAIFSKIQNENDRHIPIGIDRQTNGTQRIRMSEQDLNSITDITYLLPIRLINSQSHQMLESGPNFRRKFLDWGLFYHDAHFLATWRQYERVLKQRNRILKEGRPNAELTAWTDELLKHGLALDRYRTDYINLLLPHCQTAFETLLPGQLELKLQYQSGWGSDDFEATLAENRIEERRAGFTLFGPHRADLEVTCRGVPVKHFLSRGQQKLLICGMILGQGMLLKNQKKKEVIYLVDDLPAELDFASRKQLMTLLLQQQAQVFITAINSSDSDDVLKSTIDNPTKVFHVEHGKIRERTSEAQ